MDPTLNQTQQSTDIVDTMLSPILAKTYTKTQAIRRLKLIREFINFKLFKSKLRSEDVAENQGRMNFLKILAEFEQFSLSNVYNEKLGPDLVWVRDLGHEVFANFTVDNVNSLLKSLEEWVNKSKMVIVYLSVDLPEHELEKIGSWFKTNFGQNSLFETSLDPSLIGGCALSVQGVYKDYSIKQKVSSNKTTLIEALSGFRKSKN